MSMDDSNQLSEAVTGSKFTEQLQADIGCAIAQAHLGMQNVGNNTKLQKMHNPLNYWTKSHWDFFDSHTT